MKEMKKKIKVKALSPETKSGDVYQTVTGVASLGAAALLSTSAAYSIRPRLPGWKRSLYNIDPAQRWNSDELLEQQFMGPVNAITGPVDDFLSDEYSIDPAESSGKDIKDEPYIK